MSDEVECRHGLDPRWCASCKQGPQPRPSTRTPVVVATFTAKYDGHCTGCNLSIFKGQRVHKLENGAYVHEGCE